MQNWFGVDIGGTEIKWALISDDYKVIDHGSVPTAFDDPKKVLDAITDLVKPDLAKIKGIGVSVPGTVFPDDPDGVVYGGGSLTYMHKFALGKELQKACGVPVVVTNDGKSGALGEYASGVLKGSKVGVVMVLGTGVGGGIIIDGRLLYGAHSFGGEFSFIQNNNQDGLTMENMFGRTGGWVGLKYAVLEESGEQDDPALNGKMLFEDILSGNDAAVRGFHKYCRGVATTIMNLQAILDPDIFAIAGGISAQEILIKEINHQISLLTNKTRFPQYPQPVVVQAKNRNNANVVGAVYALKMRVSEQTENSKK
jgi:predicted NBD/HSP70 family sugar kinase